MKPQTWFIDIDGVIFEHLGQGPSVQWHQWPPSTITVNEHAREFLDWLESNGHHIVLTTARPEHYRANMVQTLRERCIVYHQLVMGITSGTRYLVNDLKPCGSASAVAINCHRNKPIALRQYRDEYSV